MIGATCPACGGPGTVLGRLGRLLWWRCRNCGIDFNAEGEELDDDDE